MKSFLPIFALLLLVAVGCHGIEETDTCPSAEILVISREEVRKEIQQQLTGVQAQSGHTLQCVCNYTDVKRDIYLLEEKLKEEIARQNEQVLARINAIHERGASYSNPAASCKEILDNEPKSPSGNYWIEDKEGNPVRKYCDMTRTCGGITGGWTKIAALDMRDCASKCPNGLRERQHPGHRLCGMNINGGGCSSAYFAVDGIQYEHVCGKIIAYQFGSTDSFGLHPPNQAKTIDQNYLDGISLTYGQNPRKHVWSFAAALDEVPTFSYDNCPCAHTPSSGGASPPRSFVGNDYFCDTASEGHFVNGHLYAEDPLWDGAGCGPLNTCCSFNNPPWFFKQLPSSTCDDIELRICCNQDRNDEDVRIEQIELYVQ